jgi:hypothetical protein
MQSITKTDLQKQRERLQGLSRAELRNLVQRAQDDVTDIRYRYELGELTLDEVKECCRRPQTLVVAIGQELERRGEAGR